ncbi:cation:proton antiporter [Autumnicola edwardsiae]|uniref:Cation:proton antiporter n=1 Tax=Autumnicola edwardsiae TaxID=3075594 RepID=A0ABU3CWQ7_9FLAO|nr:cation:proton antiporter [Zunongwangia sp. F297]MDT0650668.1 cation:proton antiporter [Zunongwangia sp. F297]
MDLMLIIFIVSILTLSLGLVYKKMQEIFLTEPLIAMITGVLIGPYFLDIIPADVPEKLTILRITCEFTIAMALMATALRIPKNFFYKNFKTQVNVVLFGMVFMWLFSSGILYLIFSDFSISECLLLGAIITPTDPVLASSIVSGDKAEKYLPASIRETISFESGINDGLAFPIVFFSIFLFTNSSFPVTTWLSETLLYETVLCGVIAYFTGILAGKMMHKAHGKKIMTTKAVLPFSLGLAFALLTGFNLLGMNGILAVFIGGLGYARSISGNEDIQEEEVQESMERITLIPVFFVFGLVLPLEEWISLGWSGVLLVFLVLFFRRIPGMFLLKPFLPQLERKNSDVLLLGWFGPIGVAALYYSILSIEKTSFDEAWIIPGLVVFASTVVHGLTSLPLGKLYHKYNSKN